MTSGMETKSTNKMLISLIISPVLLLLLAGVPKAQTQDEDCSPLFFTPAWQECFQQNLQRQFQKTFELAQPRIPMFQPGEHGNFQQSWSSSSHTGNAASSSVMSNNGRTWIIRSEGLSMSSSTSSGADTLGHVKFFIGAPTEVKKSFDESENSMKIDLIYPNGVNRWISVKLVSPTKIKELKVDQRENMIYIEGPL